MSGNATQSSKPLQPRGPSTDLSVGREYTNRIISLTKSQYVLIYAKNMFDCCLLRHKLFIKLVLSDVERCILLKYVMFPMS